MVSDYTGAGRQRTLLIGTLALAIAVTIALAYGEIALRLTNRPRPAVIGWRAWGARPEERNDFGFRGHRLDAGARLRMMLLGDSQVEAARSAFDEIPEFQLQRELVRRLDTTVSVVSIGAGGWGQDQQLLALMRHITVIRPRTVVLWFTPNNDLWNNTFPTHFPKNGWPKPTFWLEGGELRGPNVQWLAEYRPPGLYLAQAIRRVNRAPNYPTDEEWERRLPPAYRPTIPGAHSRPLAAVLAERRGIRVDELPYFDQENFETEKTHFSMYLVPRSPRLEYAAALTRALLLRTRSVCEAHGAKLLILRAEEWETLPESPTLFEVNGRGYTLSSASARQLIDGVLDGLATLHVEWPRDAVVSKTDSHLNAEGNRYVMQSLARQLAPLLARADQVIE
jgi:hypothetical protein